MAARFNVGGVKGDELLGITMVVRAFLGLELLELRGRHERRICID